MKVVIVLAIAVSMSFALIPWSFRYQSTAFLWEDDYDLLFDPARMPEIEGTRVYTNLSNFVTGSENLFSDGSMPFFLIGGSTYFMNYYPGLVYDRSKMKTALYTGLDDPDNNFLYGEGEVQEITWWDNDGNGVYDERWIETEKRSAYDADDEADYFAGIATRTNGFRFGIGFMRDLYKNTFTDPENNFTYEYTEEDLPTASYTFIQRASSAGDNIFDEVDNEFILSVWYDSDYWSAGLRTGYGFFDWTDEAIIFADSVIYTDPADSLVNEYTTAAILDSLDAPQSGTRIPVYLTVFYNYSETAQGRFYLGFETESHEYDAGAISFYNKTRENIYPGDLTWNYDTTFTYYAGDGNTRTISAGTKHLWKINKRFNFGIGALFSTQKISDSTTAREMITEVEVYDDDDGVADIDDYTQTVWRSETWMTKTTGTTKNFVFPVGVEFYVVNPALALRLGATYTLGFNDYTTVRQMIEYEPERTRIEYGDGSISESMDDPGYSGGYSETQTETVSNTHYVFGLGWRVNKNLQIDLMGFTELFDMTDWELSATLRL